MSDYNADNCSLDKKATSFLDNALASLTPKDFHLPSKLLVEWHTASSLDDLISKWKPFHKSSVHKSYAFLHILYFNVRGLDSR